GHVRRSGSAALSYYFGAGSAQLFAGRGDDRIDVQGAAAHAALSIHAGEGADRVYVGNTASAEDTFLSPLTVYGDAGDDILVGNGRNHTLDGGAGRDPLIAGAGPATLLGGGDEDILVGGTTAYDLDSTALEVLAAEWARRDVAYAERVYHLRGGGGLNGATRLDRAAFTSNGGVNVLTGADGLDLFYGSKARDT